MNDCVRDEIWVTVLSVLKILDSLSRKMGHMGARWVGGGGGGRGLPRACVGRPSPWWRAWWSAACAFGGAAEPRRRHGCTHRGWWGGAVRWPGASALGGGRPCAALASDGGGVPAAPGWSRPRFPARCRAASVGGGIAAAPRVRTGRTRHGKHAPCACMRPLRAPCVPSPCAGFRSSLRVPALRMPAGTYCVHGALVQFVVDMCMLEPMPAARAHAMRARAVRLRAGRVVHLCRFLPHRAASARKRRRHRGELAHIGPGPQGAPDG